MKNLQMQRQLEKALIAFFALVALSIVAVCIVDPSLGGEILSLPPSAASSYPLFATLFLVGVLALIAVLIVGVRRHWRWVFWIVLLAFSAALLDIPVTLLQLAGVQLPGFLSSPYPVWYSLYRMGIACLQVGIAIWMWRIYAQHGTWAQGKKKSERAVSSRT